jgi:uncharacterized protein DUF4232
MIPIYWPRRPTVIREPSGKDRAVDRRIPGWIGCAALAMALAACGLNSHDNTPNTGLGKVVTVTATPSSATTPPSPSAHTTPKPVLTPPTTHVTLVVQPCKATQTKVTADSQQGAAGTIVQRFKVANTGSVTCTMDKNPFLSPYGLMIQGGSKVEANLNIAVAAIPSNFGALGAVGGVQTVQPGDYAVFFLKWSQVPVGNTNTCQNADGFDFRPAGDPDTNDQVLVAFKFAPCGTDVQVSQMFDKSVGS